MAASRNTFLFVCFLIATTVVVVPAAAQGGLLGGILGGVGGLLGGVLGGVGNVINLLSRLLAIQGTLFCSANLNAAVGSGGIIVSPPLSNVTVQLRCGPGNGTVVGTSITNAAGQFSILLNLLTFPLTQVLNGCRLVVATPIAQCNATVPAVGTLVSNLIPNGTITLGSLRIPLLGPGGFLPL